MVTMFLTETMHVPTARQVGIQRLLPITILMGAVIPMRTMMMTMMASWTMMTHAPKEFLVGLLQLRPTTMVMGAGTTLPKI